MLLTVPGKSGGGAGGAGGGASVNVVQQGPNKVVLQAPSPGAAGKTASTITGIAQVQETANKERMLVIKRISENHHFQNSLLSCKIF